MTVRILTGDCMARLRDLEPQSVQCVVTSPPYFGLRDYGQDGQIGLEETPAAYIDKLVSVFREVRRVLRGDGTVWLNLGDSYAGGGGFAPNAPSTAHSKSGKYGARGAAMKSPGVVTGAKPKDLLMIPARVALALQAPQHYGPIKREVDRAWLAALVDGEGTIGIKRGANDKGNGATGTSKPHFSLYLTIGNQNEEVLKKCAEITGYGRPRVKDRPYVDGRGVQSHKTYYGWWISSSQAMDVIRDIYPYLIIKKKQAALAATLDKSNKNGKELRGNGPLPQSEQEKREQIKSLCDTLNQGGTVDVPDWIVEPESNVFPGWYLRSDVIWSKPNPMPESVTDRPTSAHEHVFLLTKGARYFYDSEAVREEAAPQSIARVQQSTFKQQTGGEKDYRNGVNPSRSMRKTLENFAANPGRNLRNVWEISSQPYPGAHFAVFPPALAERCIKAGSREGDTILDPFGGAGTTGLVADRLGRHATLIELSPDYAEQARGRIAAEAGMFANVEVQA